MTIGEAARAMRARQVSSTELTRAAIQQIGRLNPKLNAFITLTAESALERARQADSELAGGSDRGPLHGIPIAHKDLFLTRGVRTTSGSKIYEDFVPDHDAAVLEKLDAAGAVSLGKLNMHELAYGITSENPHYGAVRNPRNLEHIPGGSSGGSGAAVAAELVFAATGSDTGGSIRIPAAFCGVVGLKPTYGRVSRFGALPLAFSLDHMGPLTRSVRDAALVLNAVAGYDPRDPASSRRAVEDFLPAEGSSLRGVRIGISEEFFQMLDPEVESAVRAALREAESAGAAVRPVRLPDLPSMTALAQIILLAEAAAVMQPHLSRREQFGPDVLALLDQGCLVAAADYINAQRLRRRIQREMGRVWEQVDCVVAPAAPILPPRIGQMTVMLGTREEDVRSVTTRFMRPFNLLGLPALSMPCGVSGAGLPIGLQVVGPPFGERLVLHIGAAMEDCRNQLPR